MTSFSLKCYCYLEGELGDELIYDGNDFQCDCKVCKPTTTDYNTTQGPNGCELCNECELPCTTLDQSKWDDCEIV